MSDERLVIVTNNTYKIAPFANILYACDGKWWREHFNSVDKNFKGELGTHFPIEGVPRMKSIDFRNSGANAISLAAHLGCESIFMLGYDCSIKLGYHWHGKHEGKLTNCQSLKDWPDIFKRVSVQFSDIMIVNLSRYTELTCFERGEVEEWLTL